jgi:hypothetical protein
MMMLQVNAFVVSALTQLFYNVGQCFPVPESILPLAPGHKSTRHLQDCWLESEHKTASIKLGLQIQQHKRQNLKAV